MDAKTIYPINSKRLISTFVELASISSPSWNEHEIIAYIEKRLKKLGVKCEKYPCGSSFNLLGVLDSDSKKEPILLSAHMDTVTPCDKVKPIISGGKIMSDGTSVLGSDNKAAIAMFLEAFEVMRENSMPHGRIEMLLSCAEEVGLCGAKGFDISLLKAKIGYVLDGNGPIGSMILKAPYQYDLKLIVKGKAAHAGMEPERGINAIVTLADIISKLPNGRLDHETTINAGVISGGRATNVVAPEACCLLEMRSIDIEKIKNLEREVRETAKQTCAYFGAKLRIEKTVRYHGFILKENNPAVKSAKKAMLAVNIKPLYTSSGGGSDTNIFNKSQINAVNLSSGMNNVHTTSEFIKIKDIIKGADLALSLINCS